MQGWFKFKLINLSLQQTKEDIPYDLIKTYRKSSWQIKYTLMIKVLTKLVLEGSLLNLIENIYEKTTANTIINGEEL